MVEIDITLSRIEDSVILINGETAKTVETSTQFINYFFFTATSVNYTASTMTLKYDEHEGWTPAACLAICTNDPSSETYAIRITTPKFSSSTSSVEYRTVYAVGVIQTDSPLVSSSYNIGVRSNGCPEVEIFILSYETFDDDSKKTVEHDSEINFNVEYIIKKNIDSFSGETEADMLNIVARKTWDNYDGSWSGYSASGQCTYEDYPCSGDSQNARLHKTSNKVTLKPGFFKTSGSSFDELLYTATHRKIEDGEDTIHRVDLEFNEPLEAIGYHTFYLGKHYNDVDVPNEEDDDYIAYYDSVGDSYYYFPGEKSANINRNTFFDGKLSCTEIEQKGTDYVNYDGAKRICDQTDSNCYSERNENEYLFEESNNIKGIKTGKYLKIIGNQAFKKLRNLKYIDFENSPLERIGMYAFEGCTSLSAITIPDTVSLIGEGAFKRSGIESVEIPSGLTEIEDETFRLCKNLREVDFSNCTNLYEICKDAFRGCNSLTSLTFPPTLRYIERMAFGECSSLTSVTFNSGLQYIGYRAFDKTSLESVDLSESTGAVIGDKAFQHCNIQEVIFPVSGKCMSGVFHENENNDGISLTIPKGFLFVDENSGKQTAFHKTTMRKVTFLAKNLSEIAAGDAINVPFFSLNDVGHPSDCYIDLYVEKGIWDVISQGSSYSGGDRFAQWLIDKWVNNGDYDCGDIYTRDSEDDEYYKVHSRPTIE